MIKLGLKGDTSNSISRDFNDNDKTILRNNSIDIIKFSGVTSENVLDICHENPHLNIMSLNTGVTASSSITLGITGGNYWNLSAGNDFHIGRNNTEIMTFSNNHNIGVGVTNPEYSLDIAGAMQIGQDLVIQGNVFIKGTAPDHAEKGNIWIVSDTNDIYNDYSGNVGIGITNPSSKLDVVGDINTSTDYNINGTQVLSSTTLGSNIINSSLTSVGTLEELTVNGDVTISSHINIGSTKTYISNFNESMIFFTNETSRLKIYQNGNVGIGTDNPLYLLDVFGDINTLTDYNINGTQVLSTTTLGSSVINSSLTSVGTLNTLNVTGDIDTLTDYNINGTQVLSSNSLGIGITNSSLTSVGTLSTLNVSSNIGIGITTPSINLAIGKNDSGLDYDIIEDELQFFIKGQEIMKIDENSNLIMNNGSVSNNSIHIGLANASIANGGNLLLYGSNGNGDTSMWRLSTGGSDATSKYDTQRLIFTEGGTERMTIESGGNVLINNDLSVTGNITGKITKSYFMSGLNVSQSILNNTPTRILWNTSVHTTADITESSGIITFETDGLYMIEYKLVWTSINGTGIRSCFSNLTDSITRGSEIINSFTQKITHCKCFTYNATATDTLDLFVKQTSGTSINLSGTFADEYTYISITRLGEKV